MPDERGNIQLGVGAADWAPDYESERPHMPLRPGTSAPSDPKWHLLSPDEVAILGMIRNLRQDQQLDIRRCPKDGALTTIRRTPA